MPYKNIFLIDDDSDDTKIFLEAVEAVNKDVVCRTAFNPSKALEELMATQDLPDIIFLDYNMPTVNGLEFIQRIQHIDRLKHLEIIVISTPPKEVMLPWFERNNTLVRYISKPNSMDELKEILQQLLN